VGVQARHLLNAFPMDATLADGKPFWQSPKRPPTPLEFDPANPLHMAFIKSAARLFADCYDVQIQPSDMEVEALSAVSTAVPAPVFASKANMKVVTDEAVKKDEAEKAAPAAVGIGGYPEIGAAMQAAFHGRGLDVAAAPTLANAIFEKDDDANGHIDFITATSNLRAAMYTTPLSSFSVGVSSRTIACRGLACAT
jgi:ubiquitin-activating enzyme E1-like protein 2